MISMEELCHIIFENNGHSIYRKDNGVAVSGFLKTNTNDSFIGATIEFYPSCDKIYFSHISLYDKIKKYINITKTSSRIAIVILTKEEMLEYRMMLS